LYNENEANANNSGLGELLSTTFAAEGCNIAINYFNRIEPAQKVAAACEKLGVKSVIIKADMTNTSEAKRAVQETIEKLGGVDLILANAVRPTSFNSPQIVSISLT
jgi:NAD(P)-dependent dehydrogenase (short-subunit alcohol dehydrogenase family)